MPEEHSDDKHTVTCTAPVNIAVIKYWGKRDEKLILPVNSSLSATLSQEQLCAKTTVAVSSQFKEDRMWLNGHEEDMSNVRVQNVIKEIRKRAAEDEESSTETHQNLLHWKLHICSENNFPTAAGLASSAAGYACLVYSLAKIFRLKGDITDVARRGSGSACRSLDGGFVEWVMGSRDDGVDSIARQVVPEDHWSELRILILVVSGKKKHIGSTAGMQTSVKTSPLLEHRAQHLVPQRMKNIKNAIHHKNFSEFAEITMKDSNQFHAVCLDTYPPISYLTDVSRDIIHMVHKINDYFQETKVSYTFDAGPNACLYLLEKDVPMIMAAVKYFFPPKDENTFIKGITYEDVSLPPKLIEHVPLQSNPGAVQYVISTKVGPGPQVLNSEEDSLLAADGLPKHLITAHKRKIDDKQS